LEFWETVVEKPDNTLRETGSPYTTVPPVVELDGAGALVGPVVVLPPPPPPPPLVVVVTEFDAEE
jgi:hypothetical protein